MAHKAGFVNIIGNPNVGKSTLMNVLVGEKLSIITPKIQTTRHRILGISNDKDYQIVFSDTPGVLKPHYLLQEAMMKNVESALEDADVFLLMTEIGEDFNDERVLNKITKSGIPVLLLINKIDTSSQEKVMEKINHWKNAYPAFDIIPLSALEKFNTDLVLNKITSLLPESEPYFPKDELTDKPEKFFVSEIIREKLLRFYQKEIPYCAEVLIEEFKEESTIIRIRAIIYVARETQKGIIIGHKGAALKKTGTEARKDLEDFFQKHVYLELYVKVNKDWRDNEKQLKRFGYLT
jgi:GTP-binding protein Era